MGQLNMPPHEKEEFIMELKTQNVKQTNWFCEKKSVTD